MPFDIDGTERTCGAKIFTSTAADTPFFVHNRYFRGVRHIRFGRNHRDGSCRAVPRAIATIHSVRERHTILPYPHGMANLNGGFVGCGNRKYGSCRTDLRALRAFRTTIAPFVGRLGLHECHQPGRGAQHLVRTNGHAELASRAMCCHVAQAFCPGRYDRSLSLWNFFIQNNSQTAIDFLLLRLYSRSSEQQSRTGQEIPTGGIGSMGIPFFIGSCRLLRIPDR